MADYTQLNEYARNEYYSSLLNREAFDQYYGPDYQAEVATITYGDDPTVSTETGWVKDDPEDMADTAWHNSHDQVLANLTRFLDDGTNRDGATVNPRSNLRIMVATTSQDISTRDDLDIPWEKYTVYDTFNDFLEDQPDYTELCEAADEQGHMLLTAGRWNDDPVGAAEIRYITPSGERMLAAGTVPDWRIWQANTVAPEYEARTTRPEPLRDLISQDRRYHLVLHGDLTDDQSTINNTTTPLVEIFDINPNNPDVQLMTWGQGKFINRCELADLHAAHQKDANGNPTPADPAVAAWVTGMEQLVAQDQEASRQAVTVDAPEAYQDAASLLANEITGGYLTEADVTDRYTKILAHINSHARNGQGDPALAGFTHVAKAVEQAAQEKGISLPARTQSHTKEQGAATIDGKMNQIQEGQGLQGHDTRTQQADRDTSR